MQPFSPNGARLGLAAARMPGYLPVHRALAPPCIMPATGFLPAPRRAVLSLEAYALLAGSLALFLLLSAIMLATRRVGWANAAG